jgi:hypothetical protein
MISDAAALMAPECTGALPGDHDSLRLPVLKIHVGEVLTLAVNCSTSSLTAADLMDSNMSKSWCAPGSSA